MHGVINAAIESLVVEKFGMGKLVLSTHLPRLLCLDFWMTGRKGGERGADIAGSRGAKDLVQAASVGRRAAMRSQLALLDAERSPC